ncbi:MAG: DNA repair protein RecN [Opitutaceae bacterium]|nr:DNA repair protein RecN [Opitutaceae bacterium]|tara:strand:+ start:157 stop:1824 length:1668 start_codon:yes stop_codon:yes gene_type:complete
MIQFLRIQNLALMTETSLDLGPGFTVVTGETGAGKSVLLGALSMLAGNRVDKTIIRQGEEGCEVEAALFFPNSEKVDTFLEDNGLPPCEENVLLLRRSISRTKMGKVFINGKLCTLSLFSMLGKFWIDFHGPGEPQKLFDWQNQLELLDSYAGAAMDVAVYQELYSEWKSLLRQKEEIQNKSQLSDNELEYYQSQMEQIDVVDIISEAAIEALESDFSVANQAAETAQLLQQLEEGLNGDDGMISKLGKLVMTARQISEIDKRTVELTERLNQVIIELDDINAEFFLIRRKSDFNEVEAAAFQDRMNQWLEVKRKFGPTVKHVMENRERLSLRIEMQADIEGTLAKLEKVIERNEAELEKEGARLRAKREEAATNLARETAVLLELLGFKKARFDVIVYAEDAFREHGNSRCEYVFSANPGQEPLPLNKIVSSGEIARVMLALKTILAKLDDTPVLVFDEVDANVGGEIGSVVGDRLSELSGSHQIFCVTHLPQVAAKGNQHFLVDKIQTDNDTRVSIEPIHLDETGRLGELARMLGSRRSKVAQTHAKELLGAV